MYLSRTIIRALSLISALIGLLAAIGCGYGGSATIVHTTGNYSNASLKGQYVYQVHGFSVAGFYRESGVFIADGAGSITAGSVDDFTNGSLTSNQVTGTYQVFGDGTGSITLNGTALAAAAGFQQINFAITVVSSSKVDLMEGDFFADGAGTAELQNTNAIAAVPTGNFVFRLHQIYGGFGQNSIEGEVGLISISSGGAVNSGTMDQNLNGTAGPLTLTGALSAPDSVGTGTGTFTDSAGATTSFTYYIVNAGTVDLMSNQVTIFSTNFGAFGIGRAEVQSGAVGNGLAGNYAFGARGDFLPNGDLDGTATVGQFSGSGATINSGKLDSNVDGNYNAAVSFTGSASSGPSAQGRVQITLSTGDIEDIWMVSPSRAFFLTENSAKVEEGTADLQLTNSFSASTMKGQYALVMDGVDLNFGQALARVGVVTFDGSSKASIAELVNASNSGVGAQPPPGGGLTGTYQVGPLGRITAGVKNSNNAIPLDLVMYAVSNTDAYAMRADVGEVTSGTVSLQH